MIHAFTVGFLIGYPIGIASIIAMIMWSDHTKRKGNR